jgi:hypothetical protein
MDQIFCIPARGNLFLPVRLLVWADRRGTVARADSAARAKFQGAPQKKLLQLNVYKVRGGRKGRDFREILGERVIGTISLAQISSMS